MQAPHSSATVDEVPSAPLDRQTELRRYHGTIDGLRGVAAIAHEAPTLEAIRVMKECALMAVHVASRMVGTVPEDDPRSDTGLRIIDGLLLELHQAKWDLGRADGTFIDSAGSDPEPDRAGLLARFRALLASAIAVADAVIDGTELPGAPEYVLGRSGETPVTEHGAPVVPTVCPVVVIAGTNREMGAQYATQVIDIYGTWIFDHLADHVVTEEERLVLAQWAAQLDRHAPEIIEFARGWSEGANERGVPLTVEQTVAIWTGYLPPADHHVLMAEELTEDRAYGTNVYSGAVVTTAGETVDMCSGFCAWGTATPDGRLYAASTTDHDCTHQATIVAFPDEGNSFVYTPFSANGFIPGLGRFYMAGHPGFNSKGVTYVHHGGHSTEGGSNGGGPQEEWGYGVRRGAATFHALQFANTAAQARDMMLSMPVGDAGRILGTAGGLWADSAYGVAIEQRTGCPDRPRPVLRESTRSRSGALMDVLYANNNPLSADRGPWRAPDEAEFRFDDESGWYLAFPGTPGTADPGLAAARRGTRNSAARNRFFARQANAGLGEIDDEYLTAMYRTSGTIPDGSYEEAAASWNAGGEWESSAAHRGNAFTAVVKPDAGEYRGCIGPADRYLEVREPSHGYYYFDETGEFWSLRLGDAPQAVLGTALDTAVAAVADAQAAVRSAGRRLPRAKRWLTDAAEALGAARERGTPEPADRAAELAEISRRVRLACRAQVRAAQVCSLVGRSGG
ncbi:hypothetical protein [Amycolatopsis silviterrae]|uniref:Uncharacterized protein n=1 Tax=Amycolatopsis silviterrae TaxID=1656914 RepID=A0ABW5HL36_9PSEU